MGVQCRVHMPRCGVPRRRAGRVADSECKVSASANLPILDSDGAGERSRTPDLRITNALLYQLSYTGALKSREL